MKLEDIIDMICKKTDNITHDVSLIKIIDKFANSKYDDKIAQDYIKWLINKY
ncbi:MAG: hypothetical protein N2749_00990 [Clostridia bacterium]|nr:hypothetical protein [Clostridia bacterium]